MIKIELQFTTIADAVAFLSAGHAATGTALPSGEQANKQTAAAVTEAPPKPAKSDRIDRKAVAADPTPATTPVATPAASSPTAAAVAADAPETKEPVSQKQLDYAVDVSPKIAMAAKTNRAAVVAALSRFGVAKGTELTPEQWPAFVAAMDAILAA